MRNSVKSTLAGPNLLCKGIKIRDAIVPANLEGSKTRYEAHKRPVAIPDPGLKKLGTKQLYGSRGEKREGRGEGDVRRAIARRSWIANILKNQPLDERRERWRR